MEIRRNTYLEKLISSKHNGMIKVISGMRRVGKSYLLFKLFHDHLLAEGVKEEQIVSVDLENRLNKELRNPDTLLHYIYDKIGGSALDYYVLLDEVQLVSEFEDVLNSFLKLANIDVYVTGSNAKFLSKDVITEFRGRGDEINVRPLSFEEFISVKDGTPEQLLNEYLTYGGLPQVVLTSDIVKKADYLRQLFINTYIRDIKERYGIKDDADLEELIDVVASTVGGLTNPAKLENTFRTVKHSRITAETIKVYLDLMQDAFLIEKSMRYDVKGRKYIGTPSKYYFVDLGLRNARLGFRQTEFTHLLENAIYNELRLRGFSVDVGQIFTEFRDADGNRKRQTLEVDFVCNKSYKRYYIQSAYALPSQEKYKQELSSLLKLKDGFHKFVISGTPTPTYQNENGIVIMNIFDFLARNDSLELW